MMIPQQLPLTVMQMYNGLIAYAIDAKILILLFQFADLCFLFQYSLDRQQQAMRSNIAIIILPRFQLILKEEPTSLAMRGDQWKVCLSQGLLQCDASAASLYSQSVKTLKLPCQQSSFPPILIISRSRRKKPTRFIIFGHINIFYIFKITPNQISTLISSLQMTQSWQVQFIQIILLWWWVSLVQLNLQSKNLQYWMEQGKIQKKKTFCRFYLRGLCIYQAQDCAYSHGVWDLDYDYWKEDQIIEYDYHKVKDKKQPTLSGPHIYTTLYEYQVEKVFTLEEINQNRQIRSEIRNTMHQQLFEDFMQLLEIKHPEMIFTQEFLLREFTRVGFNKCHNALLKLNHITSRVCDLHDSKYFKTAKVVPPKPNKQNIVIRRATYEQITNVYKNEYRKIIDSTEKQLEQNVVKKLLFTAALPDNIPPLNQILKQRKMALTDYIVKQLGEETTKVIFQTSIETLHEQSVSFLKQKLPKTLVSWNDLYNHLTKVLKNNNANIINQVKPHLVLQHNLFLFFPMVQFIYNPELNSHIFKQLKKQQCKCSFQQPFALEQLPMLQEVQLVQGESYDINNFDSLVMCAPHLLKSKVLGVDLQGRLRKGGFVQMIQLNNGRNTFLIDIWDMNERGEFEAFWLVRKILRNVMVDPKIVKIFHDCRHDSIGLHEMIETCIVNVFDTSACETLINQLECYNKLLNKEKEKEHKQLLNECKNTITQSNSVKTPGLNEILKKYEAVHGINKNKDKYHKMWSKGDVSFFCKRPIDPDYREYCIKDVLDLPQVYEKMMKCLPEEAIDMAFWISGLYAQNGYLSIEQGQQKMEKKESN